MTEEEKQAVRQGPPEFIPKLIGKKVVMRLLSGGQPVIGIIKAHDPYEILLETPKGEVLIPKRAVAVIELADSPFT